MAGLCESGNEPASSLKASKFVHKPLDGLFLLSSLITTFILATEFFNVTLGVIFLIAYEVLERSRDKQKYLMQIVLIIC
ncbi:hypothetical protein ANN_16166 [Periplaneta americana]|uniref:Uncharacterized protein n=1 Tax=Periplaneta americana TaxID=6978 RepID=A0ABQ8SI80_PERAM|nr:hypothetical protein ANN_16166 [Periplaneta americana]